MRVVCIDLCLLVNKESDYVRVICDFMNVIICSEFVCKKTVLPQALPIINCSLDDKKKIKSLLP